ncbi:hypothetical protein [Streptococcus hyovaginalis]
MYKEYIVQTRGDVNEIKRHQQTYVISASSYEEAMEMGRQIFSEEFSIEKSEVESSPQPYSRKFRGILSIFFMMISIFLSYINWYTPDGFDPVVIAPDFRSIFIAIILYSAFVVRFKKLQNVIASFFDFCQIIVILLLFSGFINIILEYKEITVFGIDFGIDSYYVIIFMLLLSWLGMKSLSALSFIFIFLLASNNIFILSKAMGNILGPVYLISAFFGIIFYLTIEPIIFNYLPFYKSIFKHHRNKMEHNFDSLQSDAKVLTNSLTKKLRRKNK